MMFTSFRLTPFLVGHYRFTSSIIPRCKAINCQSLRSLFLTSAIRNREEPLTLCSQENGIRIITLNNSKRRNALSFDMLESIQERLSDDDRDLRVIILRSSGPVFSAGHDLRELLAEKGQDFHEDVFKKCTEVMTRVQDISVPVMAEVRGLATAAGCQLVASCDIAIASENARFATPGVNVGLFCSTPGVAVARAVPRKVALYMLFTGEPLTAHEALQHGLISKIVKDDLLQSETMKVARKICETSRPVTALGKQFFYRQVALGRDEAYRNAEKTMVDNLGLVDGQEGISAFVEKRQPKWTHEDDKLR